MKAIEKQELETLRELNKSFVELRAKLADLEIAKRNIQSQKNLVFNDLDKLSSEFKSIEADLLEKYGNVKINLETGEITDEATVLTSTYNNTPYNTANTLYLFFTVQITNTADSVTPNLFNITN